MVLPLEQMPSPTPAKVVFLQDFLRYRKSRDLQARFNRTPSAQSAARTIRASSGPEAKPRIKTLLTLASGSLVTLTTSVALHLTGAPFNAVAPWIITAATFSSAGSVACLVDLRRVTRRNNARRTTRNLGTLLLKKAKDEFARELQREGRKFDGSLLRIDLAREEKLLVLKANALREKDNRAPIESEGQLVAYTAELQRDVEAGSLDPQISTRIHLIDPPILDGLDSLA